MTALPAPGCVEALQLRNTAACMQAIRSPLLPSTSAFTVSKVLSQMTDALPLGLHAASGLLGHIDANLVQPTLPPTLFHLASMHAQRLLAPLQSGGEVPQHGPLHHVLRAVRGSLQPASMARADAADVAEVALAACVLHDACCGPALAAAIAACATGDVHDATLAIARDLLATNAGMLVAVAANLARRPEVVVSTGALAGPSDRSAAPVGAHDSTQEGAKAAKSEAETPSGTAGLFNSDEGESDEGAGDGVLARNSSSVVATLLPSLAKAAVTCCEAAEAAELREAAMAACADIVGAICLAMRASAQCGASACAPCIDLACTSLLCFVQRGLLGADDKVDARCVHAMHVGLTALQTVEAPVDAVRAALGAGMRSLGVWVRRGEEGRSRGRREVFRVMLLLLDANTVLQIESTTEQAGGSAAGASAALGLCLKTLHGAIIAGTHQRAPSCVGRAAAYAGCAASRLMLDTSAGVYGRTCRHRASAWI